MCISLEPTTVLKNAARNLKSGEIYMMFYAIVIMHSGEYETFLIKSNHNIMEKIGLYIESVALEHSTASHHSSLLLGSDQAVFSYFLSCDRKQYSATTDEHSKRIIDLLENRTVLFDDMSNIW